MAEHTLRTMLSGFGSNADRLDHQDSGEVVVIGLGRFGSALATTLFNMGHEVLGIDADADRVQAMSGQLTHVAQADTTNERSLRQLGVADAAKAVVAIGAGVEASVLTTGVLVDIGVPDIWAKALSEQHGRILQRVGAHHIVFPEADMGSRVAHLLSGSFVEYLALDEDFVLIEMVAPDTIVGSTLGDAAIRAEYRVTVVGVKQDGGTLTHAEVDTVFGPSDLIVVAGHRAHIERFARTDV